MAAVDELIDRIPLQRIAQQLGVNPAHARVLATQALPTLLAGMQANAQDPGGASSLLGALGQHDASLADGIDGLDPSQLDLADGAKIVSHIFGGNESGIVGALASAVGGESTTSGNESLIGRLLPMLAPIVMSWVSSQVQSELGSLPGLGGAGTSGTPAAPGTPAVPGSTGMGTPGSADADPLGGLLSSAMGGAMGGDGSGGTAGGSPLAGILGNLLGAGGGGSGSTGAGALAGLGLDGELGDLLGGLLGNGTR